MNSSKHKRFFSALYQLGLSLERVHLHPSIRATGGKHMSWEKNFHEVNENNWKTDWRKVQFSLRTEENYNFKKIFTRPVRTLTITLSVTSDFDTKKRCDSCFWSFWWQFSVITANFLCKTHDSWYSMFLLWFALVSEFLYTPIWIFLYLIKFLYSNNILTLN